MTQLDVEIAKTSASLWVCVQKHDEWTAGSQHVFLPKVHSTVYSVESMSVVNRLSESESKAAAAAAAAMVSDLDEAFNMFKDPLRHVFRCK